jgi:hypothetical protein
MAGVKISAARKLWLYRPVNNGVSGVYRKYRLFGGYHLWGLAWRQPEILASVKADSAGEENGEHGVSWRQQSGGNIEAASMAA